MSELSDLLGSLKQSLKLQQKEGMLAVPKKSTSREKIDSPIEEDLISVANPPSKNVAVYEELTKLSFPALREVALKCTKCPLCKSRTQVVFGTGNPKAELMFIGEAPGADEDAQGLPFVGRAGQLLTKIIEAMGFKREDVYIANILKCRPPGNRPPKPEEIEQCEPYLLSQIDHIKPKMIVALGSFAAQTLLKTDKKISGLRGIFHDYHGVRLMPTFHPAYLLRNPNDKKLVWDDMKQVMAALNKPIKK